MSTVTATAANLSVFVLLIAVAVSAQSTPTTSYTNHTVGGPAGWFFNSSTNSSATNYSSWASSQIFNLGDFLIFNTNTNQTVIQTYNETTYQSCIADDAAGNDTFQYGGGRENFGELLTIALPLTIEGTNYYFSDADDGVQCQRGMAFEIDVAHGLGLPPSLNQPPPPPYIEPPGPDTAESPPITVGGSQPSDGGCLRIGANLVWVLLCALLALSLRP
ncbi:early nodulin-like protein 18 [Ziziphus jujuba]|uniref:Early nodulin-like protein 18 n=1 Tax=Ziziphus jujuba TaxID=326968 RepID=A0ABM3ZW59_ZIZJJ|nr:early nodulin-like protein 18 [Ziziphus jujuba]XP_060668720.1 early nodulin-like protein 18 [Ziziphus jujuba]